MYVGEFVFRRTHRELIASSGKFKQTADDSAVIERMLDEAEVPLTNARLVEALLDGAHPDREARKAVELRVRNAMYLLQKAGRVRSLRLGKPVGWVWTHRPLTDDEWRERVAISASPASHPRSGPACSPSRAAALH